MSKKNIIYRQKAIAEVREIFSQARDVIKVDREGKTNEAVSLEMVQAIDNASNLLREAWKVTQLYKLNDDWMRQEFFDIYQVFGQLQQELRSGFRGKY